MFSPTPSPSESTHVSERPAAATTEVPHGITEAAKCWTDGMNAALSATKDGSLCNQIQNIIASESKMFGSNDFDFAKAGDIYCSAVNQSDGKAATGKDNTLPVSQPSDIYTPAPNPDVQTNTTIDVSQTMRPNDAISPPSPCDLSAGQIPIKPMWLALGGLWLPELKALSKSLSDQQVNAEKQLSQLNQERSDQQQFDGDQQNDKDKNDQEQWQEIASMGQLDDTAGSQDYESVQSSSNRQSANVRRQRQARVLAQNVTDAAWLHDPQAFQV